MNTSLYSGKRNEKGVPCFGWYYINLDVTKGHGGPAHLFITEAIPFPGLRHYSILNIYDRSKDEDFFYIRTKKFEDLNEAVETWLQMYPPKPKRKRKRLRL